MNTRIIRFLFGTTIALAAALLLLGEQVPTPVASSPAVAPAISSAGEITVDTTADEFDVSPNGTCSLREAILAANDLTDFGGCIRHIVLFASTETIFLPSGTYSLTVAGAGEDFDVTGDLDIRRSMIISATGATPPIVTGDVGWDDRVFHVLTGIVTINGMIIRGGSVSLGGGGGVRIESGASLTLNDSTVSGNSADFGGGIFNAGIATLTLNNVTLSGNVATGVGGGGGIDNTGTATLTNVTLSGNVAFGGGGGGIDNTGTATLTNVTLSRSEVNGGFGGGGGGIYNSGTATLNNVTLRGNTAAYVGGGILNSGFGTMALTNVTLSGNAASVDGGGIYNDGTATLTNVTFSGNFTTVGSSSGFGGGISNLGYLTATNVTLSGNSANYGGGIFNHFSATLTNVTLSGNSAIYGGGGYYNNGVAMTLTNTIVANSPSGGNCTGLGVAGSFNLSSDNTCGFGVGHDNVNVRLAPLGNYGGATLTHMLLPGSPAIDSGTNTGCPSTDQRGLPRQVNGTCDVGAVERQLVDFVFLYLPLIRK